MLMQSEGARLKVYDWDMVFVVRNLIDVETPTSLFRPLVSNQVRDCDTDSVSVVRPARLRLIDCVCQLREHLKASPVTVQEERILPLLEPKVSAVTHGSPPLDGLSIPPLLDGRYLLSNRRD